MKLWATPCRAPQDRRVLVESFDKTWSMVKERQTTSVFLPREPHELLASLPLICDAHQLLCCKLQDFIFLLPQHPCKCDVNSPFDSSGTPVWWDFSLPQIPLLASSGCDLGTFKCTTEFLSHVFLVQVHHDFRYCYLSMCLCMPFWGHHCLVDPVLLAHHPYTNLMECGDCDF